MTEVGRRLQAEFQAIPPAGGNLRFWASIFLAASMPGVCAMSPMLKLSYEERSKMCTIFVSASAGVVLPNAKALADCERKILCVIGLLKLKMFQ